MKKLNLLIFFNVLINALCRKVFILGTLYQRQYSAIIKAYLFSLYTFIKCQVASLIFNCWEAFLVLYYYFAYLWIEEISDNKLNKYIEDDADRLEPQIYTSTYKTLALTKKPRGFLFKPGSAPLAYLFLLISTILRPILFSFYTYLRRLVVLLCAIWDWWISLGPLLQLKFLLACLLAYGIFFALAKSFYWYITLQCGLFEPIGWLWNSLADKCWNRQYLHSNNAFTLYMFTMALVVPFVTYFCTWYFGLWLVEHSTEGGVARPYPFTEFELRIGVSYEELYIIVWAWLMNLLAIAHGIWYNVDYDIEGYSHPITAFGHKIIGDPDPAPTWEPRYYDDLPVHYLDYWYTWNDYLYHKLKRKGDFLDWMEVIRSYRGYSGQYAKNSVNKVFMEDLGMPLFRDGDFYHVEPGWCWSRLSSQKATYDMPTVTWLTSAMPIWIFPRKNQHVAHNDVFPRLNNKLYAVEEEFYRTLSYATVYASMNDPYKDYGKRPHHLIDEESSWAGWLHYSTYINRTVASFLGGWEREVIQDVLKDVPLPCIINAHRCFRQTCFDNNIRLDYRDWTPLGFLKKTGLDSHSWGHFWARYEQSESIRNLYKLENDPFFVVWTLAPNIRRHTPIGHEYNFNHHSVSCYTHLGTFEHYIIVPNSFTYDSVAFAQQLYN